jgi:hypothetical protein
MVSQGTLIPVMVKAIQELSKQIDLLTKKNQDLQAQITYILNKLSVA